ncbi:MAG TPA: protein kinase, partial [Vicinamibacterales bacterium]|nr:protein kinase [Vicinamibacterales bacterium]
MALSRIEQGDPAMTPERHRQIGELYHSALALAPEERLAFLEKVSAGDADLLHEVQSLLTAHAVAGSFIAAPAFARTAATSLVVGHRFAHYEVLAPLGMGGMGEVYRARDRKLGREVAIKILPRSFSADPGRRARFDREARLLAALNHPHIGAIYGVEDIDGIGALVLELIEGDTLADRLERGPIPVSEALNIARQIGDALEAAQDRGIIHRDLKPANIKITPEGVVKVIDFGLAKAGVDDTTSHNLSQSPTVTVSGRRDGVIVGTAAYMSPEQARGKPVDKRTDVWSFGCVLYEMLTGRVAFEGDTVSDTLAAILGREPDWSALQTPASLRRLLQRCLEKDPRRRLHDIADARIEIEDIISEAAGTSADETAVNPRRQSAGLRWSLAAVVTLVTVVALTWSLQTARQAQTALPRISRLTMASSGTAALGIAKTRSLTITPDGTRVLYVGSNNQLFVRALDRLDATAIFTGAAPLNWVFVSPDGQWAGFAEARVLKKVALSGGPAATIARAGLTIGATWAPDDTIIFATPDPATGLRRVSAGGGEVTVLTRPAQASGELHHLWPEMLPGGRAVLFTITATTGGLGAAQVAVLDLATGRYTVVVRGGSHAHYVASGHLVYTAEGTLRAVPFDLAQLETRGMPVTVLPRVVTTPEGAGDFAVAADGTLAYVDAPGATSAAARTLVWVDRQGREEPLGAPPRPYFHPRVSPDGNRVAVAIEDQENDIWVWDLARRTLDRLTFGRAPDFGPVWTPDGRRLVFFSEREGWAGLQWQPADGPGNAEKLTTGGPPSGVTPDGAYVIFGAGGNQDLMMLALDGTRRVQPLLQTPSVERNGVVSPDGRWLAYESDRAGQFEIYVGPFPHASEGQWQISKTGGTRPLWAPSGQELFYVRPDGALMAVPVDPHGGRWSAGSPAKVLEGPYVTRSLRDKRTYDMSTDGKRFLVVKQPPNQAAPQIV